MMEPASDRAFAMARELMRDFAGRTGLAGNGAASQRYLWTDAFAVCNFLGLYTQSGDATFLDLALELVDQVHHILGRHREDDPRSGWISGLGEQTGEQHPTAGGLRIGKPLNERGPDAPWDEALEWERDGQYFHYLSKWMHALNRVSRVTGRPVYHVWAAELAQTAVGRFVYRFPADGSRRMYWKMSIDLSRPLVPSMGQHDPLDGCITCSEIQYCRPAGAGPAPDLQDAIALLESICLGRNWVTDDPLGLGGILVDAWRLAQLVRCGGPLRAGLLAQLLKEAPVGLAAFVHSGQLQLPAAYRLAFRELGLSIGLRAVGRLRQALEEETASPLRSEQMHAAASVLSGYLSLADRIEAFWLEPASQAVDTWDGHRDINGVMLATSLMPDGFLTL